MLKKKLRIAAWYLAGCVLITGMTCIAINQTWYPSPWFELDGGTKGLLLLAISQLVLAPLLVFLLYTPSKTRLALTIDFGLIILLQSAAFVFGIYQLHQQRPVGIVFSAGQLYTIDTSTLLRQGKSVDDLAAFGDDLPVRIFVQVPQQPDEVSHMLDLLLDQGLQEHQQFNLYRPLGKSQLQASLANSLPMSRVLESLPESRKHIRRILRENPGLENKDLYFKHFIGRYKEKTIVMDASGHIVGWLPPIS